MKKLKAGNTTGERWRQKKKKETGGRMEGGRKRERL